MNYAPAAYDTRFNPFMYLSEREKQSDFVMVEFGHRLRPIAYKPEAFFIDQRCYAGVEAWHYHDDIDRLEALAAKFPGRNVAFIEPNFGSSDELWNDFLPECEEGPYSPGTILPDGAADEVFLSNVFGDPLLAGSKQGTSRLLHETGRILNERGVVVVRETLTPEYASRSLTLEMIAGAGLRKATAWRPNGSKWIEHIWSRLEDVYKPPGSSSWAHDSFYQFLTKAAES